MAYLGGLCIIVLLLFVLALYKIAHCIRRILMEYLSIVLHRSVGITALGAISNPFLLRRRGLSSVVILPSASFDWHSFKEILCTM